MFSNFGRTNFTARSTPTKSTRSSTAKQGSGAKFPSDQRPQPSPISDSVRQNMMRTFEAARQTNEIVMQFTAPQVDGETVRARSEELAEALADQSEHVHACLQLLQRLQFPSRADLDEARESPLAAEQMSNARKDATSEAVRDASATASAATTTSLSPAAEPHDPASPAAEGSFPAYGLLRRTDFMPKGEEGNCFFHNLLGALRQLGPDELPSGIRDQQDVRNAMAAQLIRDFSHLNARQQDPHQGPVLSNVESSFAEHYEVSLSLVKQADGEEVPNARDAVIGPLLREDDGLRAQWEALLPAQRQAVLKVATNKAWASDMGDLAPALAASAFSNVRLRVTQSDSDVNLTTFVDHAYTDASRTVAIHLHRQGAHWQCVAGYEEEPPLTLAAIEKVVAEIDAQSKTIKGRRREIARQSAELGVTRARVEAWLAAAPAPKPVPRLTKPQKDGWKRMAADRNALSLLPSERNAQGVRLALARKLLERLEGFNRALGNSKPTMLVQVPSLLSEQTLTLHQKTLNEALDPCEYLHSLRLGEQTWQPRGESLQVPQDRANAAALQVGDLMQRFKMVRPELGAEGDALVKRCNALPVEQQVYVYQLLVGHQWSQELRDIMHPLLMDTFSGLAPPRGNVTNIVDFANIVVQELKKLQEAQRAHAERERSKGGTQYRA